MVVRPTPHLSITTGMFPLVYRIQHTIQQDFLRPAIQWLLHSGQTLIQEVRQRSCLLHDYTYTHMIVQWENVGIFSSHTDKLNSFQLIITNGTDPILSSGTNVSFCYKNMEWTTGDASEWSEWIWRGPPSVGINKGDGVAYIQYGRFDTTRYCVLILLLIRVESILCQTNHLHWMAVILEPTLAPLAFHQPRCVTHLKFV